jgi:hypothetical protein
VKGDVRRTEGFLFFTSKSTKTLPPRTFSFAIPSRGELGKDVYEINDM